MQVDLSAAKALSEWEAIFSSRIIQQAKELAEKSGANKVSISHFRQAALATIDGLKEAIESKEDRDDDRRAA